MKVLVLGAGGMLGNAMMSVLNDAPGLDVHGSLRSAAALRFFPEQIARRLVGGINVENHDDLEKLFGQVGPQVVLNCIGLIKQLAGHDDPLSALAINAVLPHQLAKLCAERGARLIHFSTDCVFSGRKGGYVESDPADAEDLYGKSKFLGEVNSPHAFTVRTSIIGHELQTANSLLGWFLMQEGQCRGFTKAIFSGLPTVELANIVRDIIIPRPELSGLYHVAARPIAKYDLLRLVAQVYGKKIDIIADDSLVIDRSLDASRFKAATGYVAPEWPALIQQMHSFQQRTR